MAENDEPIVIDRSKWMNSNNGVKTTPIVDDTPPAVETTAEATPTTEPTVTEPATTQPATEQPTAFADIWKKEFGDADVTVVKDIVTKYNTIAPEYETLKAQPPVSPYKTDGGKQIDEWLSKGVKLETIARFHNVKAESLNAEQAIKLKMEIENPSWDASIIDAYYQSTYNHVADELKSPEQNALEENLKKGALLKAEAEAKASLSEYLDKQFNPSAVADATAQEREANLQKASQFWTSQSAAIANSVKQVNQELTVKVMSEKGEEDIKLPVSFVVPEAEQKQLLNYAIQSAVNSGIELNENGIAQVNEFVKNTVWAKYGESIARSAVEQALSEQHKHFSKIINNPTVARTTSPNTAATGTREAAWKSILAGAV